MKTATRVWGAVIFIACVLSLAQVTAPSVPGQDPLDYTFTSFEVRDASFVQAISKLSLQSIPGLHLGFEEVLRDKISEPRRPPRFSLELRNSTVREILNTLCSYDSEYMWSQDGGTVNIYPKAVMDQASYLLNRHLDRIAVIAIPDPEHGLSFLDKQLPPPREQLAYAGAGGDSAYDAPWTQTFEGLTVRQFINRLSEHMGSQTSWVFYGSKQERLFTFRKGGFH